MWHDSWSGADWALMSVAMLLFWAVVVAGVIWLVRTVGNSGPTPGDRDSTDKPSGPDRSSAQDILDERYARGELSDEEYRARRDVLSGR